MKQLFLFLAAAGALQAATITIQAGSHRWGNTFFTLANTVTVTTSGAPAATQRAFLFSDANGILNVSLPPGVTGACAGAPCFVYTTDAAQTNGMKGAAGAYPNTANAGNAAAVDPVWAASAAACATPAQTLNLYGAAAPAWPTFQAAQENGTRFRTDTAGFFCGVRFYKPGGAASTHAVSLWNASGVKIAGAVSTGEPAGGWVAVALATPVAAPVGSYTASYTSAANEPASYAPNFYQNRALHNGALHSNAFYGASNGSCDPSDAWGQVPAPNGGTMPSAGIIGCVDFTNGGTVTATSPANGYAGGQIGFYRGNNTLEGSQMLLAGVGPGSYVGLNTAVECAGNCWHHDDSAPDGQGRYTGARGDYLYQRMVWRTPDGSRLGAANSDGFKYFIRQLWECKGCPRVSITGSIFEGAFNDAVNSALTVAAQNTLVGSADFNFVNNEVRHVPGFSGVASFGGGNPANGSTTAAPPNARLRIQNNLFWDMGGYSSFGTGVPSGRGWWLQYASGVEDAILDHNTLLAIRGSIPDPFYAGQGLTEGWQVTNNIFPISGNGYQQATGYGGGGEPGAGTGCGAGEANITTCTTTRWTNYQFKNNVLYPAVWSLYDPVGQDPNNSGRTGSTWSSAMTAALVAAQWPTLKNTNFIPSGNSLASYGFFAVPSMTGDSTSYASGLDARFKSGSLFSSGNQANYPSTDGRDLGADLQQIRDAQGAVEAVSAPTSLLGATSATVVFNAPDAQACPVDFKVYDPTDPYLLTGFTRTADTGVGRQRSVQLKSLSTKTTYAYRIDCAAYQPTGQFRTK